MKIERIDDNSIALFLNSEELRNRNLKLSDLAYGSEKARNLLVEMMGFAKNEIGFTPDAPLAVETVPLKDGDIKLIITKIFNPDELDARYSRFTPFKNEKIPFSIMQMLESTIDKFEEALKQGNTKGINEVNNIEKLEIRKESNQISIFEFSDIDKASDACKNVNSYNYNSVFYKDEKNKKFYLVISIKGNLSKDIIEEYYKVCNVLAEYGIRIRGKEEINKAYYEEHFKIIIKDDAVMKLSKL